MDKDFKEALDVLIQTICDDYNNWSQNPVKEPHAGYWTPERIEVTVGKKYVKIFTPNNSIWSFVVIADNDKDFPRGTILKAQSWKAPARNHSRGNIFTGYKISWTGAAYCQTDAHEQNTVFAEQAKFNNDVIDVLTEV